MEIIGIKEAFAGCVLALFLQALLAAAYIRHMRRKTYPGDADTYNPEEPETGAKPKFPDGGLGSEEPTEDFYDRVSDEFKKVYAQACDCTAHEGGWPCNTCTKYLMERMFGVETWGARCGMTLKQDLQARKRQDSKEETA